MYDSSAILDAAREIRAELRTLLDDESARRFRSALDQLLARPDDDADQTADAVLELLRTDARTRAWLELRLASSADDEALEVGDGAGWEHGGAMGGDEALIVGGDAPAAPDFDFEPPAIQRPPAPKPAIAAPAAPPPEPGPGDAVHPRLDCPAQVVAGTEFALEVGLSAEADAMVLETPMVLPEAPEFELAMHVTADGFALREDESWRTTLSVHAGDPLPVVTLHLTPAAQDDDAREARLQVLYLFDGHAAGFASRALTVVRDTATPRAPAVPQPVEGGVVVMPQAEVAADVTVLIRHGESARVGDLMWTIEARHGVDAPDAPITTNIGDSARQYARDLIAGANMREGKPQLFDYLAGVGQRVRDNVPDELVDVLRAVQHEIGRRPTVLLLSEEPYVPWELAWIDPPLDEGAAPFLATQAVVGRWVIAKRPPLPPPDAGSAATIAAIWGVYDKVPGWKRLQAAEDEGAELVKTYGATAVGASVAEIKRCVKGDPQAGILHFALHGNYDPSGLQDGLMLPDRDSLDPTVVSSWRAAGRPFVFLNACQVGVGQQVLGDYGGLAHAFLQTGACGVVAPLWSVNDTEAKRIALHFYERVRAGTAPAEAMREERAALGPEPELTTGAVFAYQFFGHPAMKLGNGGP